MVGPPSVMNGWRLFVSYGKDRVLEHDYLQRDTSRYCSFIISMMPGAKARHRLLHENPSGDSIV